MSETSLNRRIRHCCCCEKRLTGRFVELGVCKKCEIEQEKCIAWSADNMAQYYAGLEAKKKWVYLSVTRLEVDEAREMGAMWDSEGEQWYAPTGEPALVQRWPLNSGPVVLTGENREFGSELTIDFVPTACWFTSAHKCVHPRDWRRLHQHLCERVNNCCEYCGINPGIPLEIHEKWSYTGRVQKLVRFVALCRLCHIATDVGYTVTRKDEDCINSLDRIATARDQFIKVRHFTVADIWMHLDEALKLKWARNLITWTPDLSLLTDNGIALVPDLIQV